MPDYSGFDRKFAKHDPYGFEGSAYEQRRFDLLLRVAESIPHGRILEVGCAEGHLTQKLLTICRDVTAIDVSAEAVERAKLRAPGATYAVVPIEEFEAPERRFDLVVASEVMYYVADRTRAFTKIARMTDYLLMSNWAFLDSLLSLHLRWATRERTVWMKPSLREPKRFGRISLWRLRSEPRPVTPSEET